MTLITYRDKRKAKDGRKIDSIRAVIERWAPVLITTTVRPMPNPWPPPVKRWTRWAEFGLEHVDLLLVSWVQIEQEAP